MPENPCNSIKFSADVAQDVFSKEFKICKSQYYYFQISIFGHKEKS